jgi:hypothetical protein
MPERFESPVYKPETTKLMKDAFDEVWPKIKIIENDRELTRGLSASAFLDQVHAGADNLKTIAACAVATLAVARNVSRK